MAPESCRPMVRSMVRQMERRPLDVAEMERRPTTSRTTSPCWYREESLDEVREVVGGFFATWTDESIEELRRAHALA